LRVLITATARDQYLGMIRRYLKRTARRPARPDAARRLIAAYGLAVEVIARGPEGSFGHPRPYPELAVYGFRWIKIHRYWFGYLPAKEPIITNILDAAADIPAHVAADRIPADPA
jgi:hypothetical protein